MRSGTGQKLPIGSPLITITVGGDTHKSEGGGGNDRLMRIYTDEMGWGGQFIIELDNADESLNAKNYEGEQLTLNLSFIGESSGDFPPLWVYSQQIIAKEEELRLQLNCVDIWTLIAAHNVTLANASYNQDWQQEDELSTRVLADGETLLSDGAPELYAALLANGDKTILEILQDLCTACGITLDDGDDDGYIGDLKPPVSISNARSGMRQVMDMTKSYLKYKTNGHLAPYQPSDHATAYNFNTIDLFDSNLEEVAVTIPNRVIVWAYNADYTPPDEDGWISGVAQDDDSYAKLGNKWVDRHYLFSTLENFNTRTQTQVDDYAAAILVKIQGEGSQGMLVAPMHCTLELFDKVQVTDDRYDTPRVSTGYIHRMIREYDRGVYRITIYLGGVVSGYTPPGGADVPGLAESEPPKAPVAQFPEGGLTIGAYIADIAFTSVDWDTISWGAGTVYLADGRSQGVDAGSFYMTADGAWYFYAILGNSTLQHSQDATDAVGDDRMLVAVASRGSTTEYKAYVLNPFTDSILINTDKVMDGLVTELKLANEAVTHAKLAVNSVYGACIATSAITETKISSGAVSTPKLEAGAVTTAKLDAGAVTTAKLDALAVTAEKIAASAITADKIAAGAVTAVKIQVVNLQAISEDCGTLTAGTINGVTIYGGSGDILIDSTALKIKGAALVFYYSTFAGQRGYMGGFASDIRIVSVGNYSIVIDSDYNLTLQADGNIFMNPGSSSYVEILSGMRIYSSYILIPSATDPGAGNGKIWWNETDDEFQTYVNGTKYRVMLQAT